MNKKHPIVSKFGTANRLTLLGLAAEFLHAFLVRQYRAQQHKADPSAQDRSPDESLAAS